MTFATLLIIALDAALPVLCVLLPCLVWVWINQRPETPKPHGNYRRSPAQHARHIVWRYGYERALAYALDNEHREMHTVRGWEAYVALGGPKHKSAADLTHAARWSAIVRIIQANRNIWS